jgi:hypothetical protein
LIETKRGTDWFQAAKLEELVRDLERLTGGVNCDMNYSGGTRQISFSPSLEELAGLGVDAKARAAFLIAHPAPNASVDCLRTTAIAMLEAIAGFHSWQVGMLARFTPENIEDGSYQVLSSEFGASLQPRIDSLTPFVAQFNGALAEYSAALNDFTTGIEAFAATRR